MHRKIPDTDDAKKQTFVVKSFYLTKKKSFVVMMHEKKEKITTIDMKSFKKYIRIKSCNWQVNFLVD